LRELALLFLRLGATTFGGSAAHIAVMEDEIVRGRGWLDRQEFLDLLGATNLIPGGRVRACEELPRGLGYWLILLASAVALLRFRVSSSGLILPGGPVSVLARSLG
jgi:chromate transporter